MEPAFQSNFTQLSEEYSLVLSDSQEAKLCLISLKTGPSTRVKLKFLFKIANVPAGLKMYAPEFCPFPALELYTKNSMDVFVPIPFFVFW